MIHKRILIVNPFGIGDVIFSTPLIEIIKDKYPDCFIGYMCNKRSYEVIHSNPKIARFFIYEKDDFRAVWKKSKIGCLKQVWQLLKTIRQERFDVVIDLSLGYQYSMLLGVIGIKKRFGFNYRDRGRFLTGKVEIDGFSNKHVIEYYCDMLKFLGIDSVGNPMRPKVYVTEKDIAWASDFLKAHSVTDQDLLIGVIPGCGASWGMNAKHRRWGRDGFAAVCDKLAERYNAKIILLGDPQEKDVCDGIQSILKNKAINACGMTTLRNFLGLIKRCRLIITNDGGPLHMAVGVGIDTVSIFGPVDEKVYGPYPLSGHHMVISKKDVPCRPCYKKFKHKTCAERVCLNSISPEDVLESADKILSIGGRDVQ